MIPQKKAIELVKKMKAWQRKSQDMAYSVEAIEESVFSYSKECALICVNELISAFELLSIQDSGGIYRDFGHLYWKDVKAEIEQLEYSSGDYFM